jgi:hypothetical protein
MFRSHYQSFLNSSSDGQGKGESTPFIQSSAFHPNLATVFLDNAFGYRQAEPCTGGFAFDTTTGLVKCLEESLLFLMRISVK